MDLGHRVVALVASVPKRVVCLTCNSEHNYRAPRNEHRQDPGVHVRGSARAPTPSKPPAGAGARVALKVRVEQERYQHWADKTLGKAVDAFTRYSMERRYREGELVMHPKFGEGYVQEVLEGGKVNVMFREGSKVLAHSTAK
jgi:hypothetical protein